MVYIEIPKEFDKSIIDVVAKKLELAPSYIEWLLSVGNKEALQEYNAAQQSVQSDGACESCKLPFTSSCPSLLGKLCSYYQPRR